MERKELEQTLEQLSDVISTAKPEEGLVNHLYLKYKDYDDEVWTMALKKIMDMPWYRFPGAGVFRDYLFKSQKELEQTQKAQQVKNDKIPVEDQPTAEDWQKIKNKFKKLNNKFNRKI